VETIKRQTRAACGFLVQRLQARVCGLSLQPIGCTPVCVLCKAPLQLQCAACGAILVSGLYLFTFTSDVNVILLHVSQLWPIYTLGAIIGSNLLIMLTKLAVSNIYAIYMYTLLHCILFNMIMVYY